MVRPTAGEPVKLNSAMRSSSTSCCPVVLSLGSTENALRGQPLFSIISANFRVERGVELAGLMIIGQPAAIAGATLCAIKFMGKLNGVMPATTPIGNFLSIMWRPAAAGVIPAGI